MSSCNDWPDYTGNISIIAALAEGTNTIGYSGMKAWDGTELQKVKCDSNGNLQVEIIADPDLNYNSDSVTAYQGGNWVIDSISNAVTIQDGGNSITIDTAQLPASLTAGGNLKVALQEDATGTKDVNVTNASLNVNASQSGEWTVEIQKNYIIYSGQKDVPTGTAEPIGDTAACRSVVVKASVDNTDKVYIGMSGVTTADGFELDAGEAVAIDIDNIDKVYCISPSTGQKISWLYVI